jgi:autotransporter translocation and assembly factor TamB
VEGEGLPLRSLEGLVPGLSDAEGRLLADGFIGGTLSQPDAQLRLQLLEGAVTAEASGLRYEDINVDTRIVGDDVVLRSFSLTSLPRFGLDARRPGRLEGQGRVEQEGERTSIDLSASAEGFWLTHLPDQQLSVFISKETPLLVRGDWPRLTVQGDLAVGQGYFSFGQDFWTSTQDLALDPAIKVHRKRAEEGSSGPPLPPVWSEFSVDLDLDLRRSFRLMADMPMEDSYGGFSAALSRVTIDAELDSPELRVQMRGGEPLVNGEVEITRGEMSMLGVDFNIGGGTIAFAGSDVADPILDIAAVHSTGSYGEVVAHVTGPASTMNLSFTNDQYPDQTDVISILMLGKPASEVESGSGAELLGMAVRNIAGGGVSQVVGSSFSGRLELEQGMFRVGWPLSDRWFLGFQYEPQDDPELNILSVSLEWLISRRMYAELMTGDRGQTSSDLYWRWRF